MKRRLGRLPVLVAWVLLAALVPAADAAPRDAKSRALERSHAAAESALARARALRAGRGVVTGRELTPALAELSARYEALDPAERRQADRLLARPTEGAGDPQGDGYTVPEHAPLCTANFCLHWVTSTPDAPDLTDTDGDDVPDYVETMAAQFELSRTRENGDLGWRLPVSDGARGGDGRLDVYLIELAGTGVLGYAATDPGQADPHAKFAYMVMDQDLAADVLQATAAHEYNHVLQFAYDAAQDTWMFESTAVWMEDRVFDSVDHYLGFISTWATLDEIPLARTFQSKHYGSGVWNMWLDARHGPELIRTAWSGSAGASPQSFAPGAYDAALLDGGFDGFSASFVEFVADVAEWRRGTAFPEGAAYADAQRRGSLQAGGAPVSPALDHTAYALYTVPQPAGGWPAVLRLDGELPAGVTGGLALVARTGADPLAGTVVTVPQQLPAGGAASVQLEDPAAYGRITAVLVNADTDTTAFQGGDWVFSADAQPFIAAAGVSGSTSATPANTTLPSVTGTPQDGQVLTARNGAWSGSAPMAYARQWSRCDGAGAGCADIPLATGMTYTATAADVGKTVRVRVDASNGAGNASAQSAATAAVAAIPPASATAPVIDDTTPAVGDVIHVTDGTWNGSQPLTFARQWRRCSPVNAASCVDIAGAGASAYTVTPADAGSRLRARVTATNPGGSAFRDSGVTEVVTQPAAGPANTALPTVSGVANDGETLTAGAGTWTGSPTPTVTREWLRCSGADLASCAGTGASGTSYVLAPADVGSRLRVRETAQNSGGTADATSAATAVVTADAPQNTTPPQITGTASQGQVLTATDGTWSGTPPAFARQWRRCDAGTCTDIGGATSSTYQLAAADVGKTVLVRVTATNPAGSESADSAETAAVAGPPVNAQVPAVSGVANDGETLTAQAGAWTGSPAPTVTRAWMRCSGAGVDTCAATGAIGAAHVLGPADVGSRMRVRERAQNGSGTVDAFSAATAVVTADALQNDAPPTVTGTAKDGELLTAADGTWSGTPPAIARRWRRCDGAACADIAGATASTYLLTSQDVGKTIRVAVTATNAAGSAGAESAPTAAVAARPVANTIAPSLSGDAVDGAELTSAAGSWTGSTPILLTRRWQRCSGLTCTDVPGAVGERYRLGLADVLQQVRVVVTGSNAAGALEAASALSAPVRAAPAQPSGGGTPGGGSPGGGAPAGPPSPAAALSATFKAPAKAKLAAALAGKLAVPVTCSAACTVAARVELPKKAAKKLGVPAVIARGSGKLAAAGRASVKLAFASKARKRLRKARTVAATLVVEARDAAGALAAQRRGKLTLRR
jgi:hypothetical protein